MPALPAPGAGLTGFATEIALAALGAGVLAALILRVLPTLMD